MERDFLKKLGLDSDTTDKVMAQYGKDLQDYKAKAAKADELQSTIDDQKEQLSQRDKQLKDLQKNAGDNQDLKAKLDKAIADNKQQAKDFSDKLAGIKKNNAIKDALTGAGAKNAKAVAALMDLSKVSLDDNGSLIGLNDQIKAVKKSDGYLFKEEQQEQKPAPKVVQSGNPKGSDHSNGDSLVEKIAARMQGKE